MVNVCLQLMGCSKHGSLSRMEHMALADYSKTSSRATCSNEDAKWIVKEVFEDFCYKDVVGRLPESGAFVIDVGANIGSFAVYIAKHRPGVSVLCLEPVPLTAEALRMNVAQIPVGRAENIRPVQMGLAGPGQEGSITFTCFEDVPACSTVRVQDKHEANIQPLYTPSTFVDYYKDFNPALSRFIASLPEAMQPAAVRVAIAFKWRFSERPCSLGTLDQAFAAAGLEIPVTVDLLKVDVEGLELMVLENLEEKWWPKINAVIVEVHDLDGRLNRVLSLLGSHGFNNVRVTQDLTNDLYNDSYGMNHHFVVAMREGSSASAVDSGKQRRPALGQQIRVPMQEPPGARHVSSCSVPTVSRSLAYNELALGFSATEQQNHISSADSWLHKAKARVTPLNSLDDLSSAFSIMAQCWSSKPQAAQVLEQVVRQGEMGVLLRGCPMDSPKELSDFFRGLPGLPLFGNYTGGTAIRKNLDGNVDAASLEPPQILLPPHQEMSYSSKFPTHILFYCFAEAEDGGETILADIGKWTELVDPMLKHEIREREVQYEYFRTFAGGFDNWPSKFGCDQATAEASLNALGHKYEWHTSPDPTGRYEISAMTPALRCWNTRPGFILTSQSQRQSNRELMFNQLHVLHHSYFEQYGEQGKYHIMPHDVRWGDGAEINIEVIQHLRETIDKASCSFKLRRGDMLLLDNISIGHGRLPYAGSRSFGVLLLNQPQ